MIISRISGGIGNQLFQYALGRALSARAGAELKLDTHYYETPHGKGRSFELPAFRIKAGLAADADFAAIGVPSPRAAGLAAKARRRIFRALESAKPLSKRRFVVEPSFRFSPDVLAHEGDAYLSGVWQSEKYFKAIEGDLRAELSLKERSALFEAWQKKVSGYESVSLHVRRGDYASSARANALHGLAGADYYERAVEEIRKRTKNPVFFVFSDDVEWAKEHIHTGHETHFVSGAGLSNPEELALMSECRHNVIANSTFSWWAAWLNKNPDKAIIAPKEWFRAKRIDASDLFPSGWIRL